MADPSPLADISGITGPTATPTAEPKLPKAPKLPEAPTQQTMPPDPLTQAEALEALALERAKLPTLEKMNEMDAILDRGAGIFDLEGALLGMANKSTFGLTGKLVGKERASWKGRGWKFGTTERDDQITWLSEIVVERNPEKEGNVTAEDVQTVMQQIIADALDDTKYNTWDPSSPIHDPKKKNQYHRLAAKALNTFSSDVLGYRAESSTELYRNFKHKYKARVEAGENARRLAEQSIGRDEVEGIRTAIIDGKLVHSVPSFNSRINEIVAGTAMDPVTQALLLSNTPIKVLKSMEEHLRKERSPERLKSALGEKGARNYTQLQNAYFATRPSRANEAFVPLYETSTGLAEDLTAQQLILEDWLWDREVFRRGYNANVEAGAPGGLPKDQNQAVRDYARNRAQMIMQPIKMRGKGLVVHKDPTGALRAHQEGRGFYGGGSRILENVANLGWAMYDTWGPWGQYKRAKDVWDKGEELLFPPPEDVLARVAAKQGQYELATELSEEKKSTSALRKVGDFLGVTDISVAVEHLFKHEKAESLPPRFLHAFAANLLPTRKVAGIVTRDGELVDYVREEMIFEAMAQDDSLLSMMMPDATLDWFLRIAQTEVLGTSYAMAAEKYVKEEQQLSGGARAAWFAREMADNIGTPAMTERLTQQEADIGTLFLEFGDAFLDWVPGGDRPAADLLYLTPMAPWWLGLKTIIPEDSKFLKQFTVKKALGAAMMGPMFLYEIDGFVATNFAVAGALRTGAGLRKGAKLRTQDYMNLGSENMKDAWRTVLSGEVSRAGPAAEAQSVVPSVAEGVMEGFRYSSMDAATGARRVARLLKHGDRDEARVEEAFNSGSITMQDVEYFLEPFRYAEKNDPTGATSVGVRNAKLEFMAQMALDDDVKLSTLGKLFREEYVERMETVSVRKQEAQDAWQKVMDTTLEPLQREKAMLEFIESTKEAALAELAAIRTLAESAASELRGLEEFEASMRGKMGFVGDDMTDITKFEPEVSDLLSVLDDLDMVKDAARVFKNELSVEDFVRLYEDRLKKAKFITKDAEGAVPPNVVKDYFTAAFARFTTQPASVKAVKMLAAHADKIKAARIVSEQATAKYEAAKKQVITSVLDKLRAAGVKNVAVDTIKDIAMPDVQPLIRGIEKEITRITDGPLRLEAEREAIAEALLARRNAPLARALTVFAEALERNMVSMRVFGSLEDKDLRQLRNAYEAKGSSGLIENTEDVGAILNRVESTIKNEGIQDGLDPVDAVFEAERLVALWEHPEQFFHQFRKQNIHKELFQTFRKPVAWTAYIGVELKRLARKHPFWTRWPRFQQIMVHDELDFAARRTSRRIASIYTAIEMVVKHSEPEEIWPRIEKFLVNNGEPIKIESVFGKIKFLGMEVPAAAFPWMGVKDLNIGAVSDLSQSLLRYAFDNLEATRATREAQAPLRQRGLTPDLAEDTLMIDAIIKSFVDEQTGRLLNDKSMRKTMRKIRSEIFSEFQYETNKLLKTDSELMGEFLEIVLRTLRVNGVDVVKEGTARFNASRTKYVQSLVAAAAQGLLDREIFHVVGMRHTPSQVEAMNYINRGFDSAGLEEMNATRMARPWQVGEEVIDREFAELMSSVYTKGDKFRFDPEKPIGERIKTDRQADKRPWYQELDMFKTLDAEDQAAFDVFNRIPIFEEVVMRGLGKESRTIVKIDESTGTLTLDDGRVVQPGSVVRRDISLAFLDALDGMAKWGFEAFGSPGRKKVAQDRYGLLRDTYTAMVMHSTIDGGTRAIPRAYRLAWEQMHDRFTKDLSEYYSEARTNSFGLARAWSFYKPGLVLHSLWRQHILFGVLTPRLAYQPIQWFQDAVSLTYYHGLEGAGLALIGGLGYIPYIGPAIQKDFIMRALDLPEGMLPGSTMTNLLFNRSYDEFFEGTRGIAKYEADGTPVTYADLHAEAWQVSAWDFIGSDDLTQMSRNAFRSVYKEDSAWWDFYIAAKEEWGIDAQKAIREQFLLGIQDAVGRMRAITYWYYRVQKNMTKTEAERMLDRTLINWNNSVSPIEKKLWARPFLFYTLHKNGFLQALDAFTEMAHSGETMVDQLTNYGTQYLRGKTRAQRIRFMSRFMALPVDWAPSSSEILTPEELRESALRVELSSFITQYPIIGMPKMLPIEAQEAYTETTGRKVDFMVPTLPMVSQLEYTASGVDLAELMLALPVAINANITGPEGEVIPYSVNGKYWAEEGVEFLMDYLKPSWALGLSALTEAMSLTSRGTSLHGKRVTEGNKDMYEYFMRMGMWPTFLVSKSEHRGEMRFKYHMGPANWWAKEYMMDPSGVELTRLDNYLTVVFGNELDEIAEFQKEHPIIGAPLGPVGVSGKVKALTEGEGDMAARREAFRFSWSLHRTMLINAALEKEWRIKSQSRESDRQRRLIIERAEQEQERYLESVKVPSED